MIAARIADTSAAELRTAGTAPGDGRAGTLTSCQSRSEWRHDLSCVPSSVDEYQSGAIPGFPGELEPMWLGLDGDVVVDCLVGPFIGTILPQVTRDCILNLLVSPFLAHHGRAVGQDGRKSIVFRYVLSIHGVKRKLLRRIVDQRMLGHGGVRLEHAAR